MDSAKIDSCNFGCGGNSAKAFALPEMPNTQQESSFIVGEPRGTAVTPTAISEAVSEASSDAASEAGTVVVVASSNPAPLFSFDEEGDICDIFPRVGGGEGGGGGGGGGGRGGGGGVGVGGEEGPFTPHNSVDGEFENPPPLVQQRGNNALTSIKVILKDHQQVKDQQRSSRDSRISASKASMSEPTTPRPQSRRRKFGMVKSTSATSSTDGQNPPQNSITSFSNSSVDGTTNTEVNVVLEQPPKSVVPKIDFHAPSIEVVEDYLEGHLPSERVKVDDGVTQMNDLYSLFGDAGLPGPHTLRSSQGSSVSLLSATPQETPPKRQRVPFDTVVFTERKPSTGDALIQSLGLSEGDGADTIQDIASKNQGAARERLQLAEGGQTEASVGLTSHCESCGVSPEDCLKKLGLHSDRERVLSPSPKSEKLWQLFQQIQAGLARVSRNRRPSGSEPQLDVDGSEDLIHQHMKATPTKSRSLDASPIHSPLNEIRKPMMHTV